MNHVNESNTRVNTFNMNLLIALDVLVQERSVTRAASRLNITPPAMSKILSKVRETFNDEILIRTGNKLVPTQRSLILKDKARLIINDANELFQPKKRFNPRTAHYHFNIITPQIGVTAFSFSLIKILNRIAPNITITFSNNNESSSRLRRHSDIDLYIGERLEFDSHIVQDELFDMEYGLIMKENHPLLQQQISIENLLKYKFIVGDTRANAIDKSLNNQGLHRNISVQVACVHSKLKMISNSLCISLSPYIIHRNSNINMHGLTIIKAPEELPKVTLIQAWHPIHSEKPEHIWLRNLIKKFLKRRNKKFV